MTPRFIVGRKGQSVSSAWIATALALLLAVIVLAIGSCCWIGEATRNSISQWIYGGGHGSDSKPLEKVSKSTRSSEKTTSTTTFEDLFLQVPSADSCRRSLKYITHQSHVAGTPGDFLMARFVQQKWQASLMVGEGSTSSADDNESDPRVNLRARPSVSQFDLQVLLNYPIAPPRVNLWRRLSKSQPLFSGDPSDRDIEDEDELVYEASLTEDVLDEDTTSDRTQWRNHTFHGYSPSGHIFRAPLIYVNYGRLQDFVKVQHALSNQTGGSGQPFSFRNTIVIARYGKCFRGLKVRNAQRFGAVGVILYSDPADDGYGQGPTYDHDDGTDLGPWRPSSGIQRGSVQFNSQCAGDPARSDPRYQSILNTTVEDICFGKNGNGTRKDLIPSIPSVPMSYRDAKVLLQHITSGPLASSVAEDFVGGIRNLTYRIGPSAPVPDSRGTEGTDAAEDDRSDAEGNIYIELEVQNEDAIRTVPNVVGMIPGQLPPEQDMPVLLGNHRDAWVYGAADPNSGTASLLEVVKGLGVLYNEHGWRPLRSIYFLSWSGEEYGLLGSTGWAELNGNNFFIKRALAYLNVDTAVSGDILSVSSSPSLTTLWRDVMSDIANSSVSTEQSKHGMSFANAPFGEIRDANTNSKWSQGNDTSNDPSLLGSGSDYTVFLDHFGIPCIDFDFGKKAAYGQYHSIYDSFTWMDLFGGTDGEPGSSFDLMALSAKIWGVLAIRLASSPLVLLDHNAQGLALSKYVEAIRSKCVLDTADLANAVERYRKAAAQLQIYCRTLSTGQDNDECNEKLGMVEREFLTEMGLPRRPWFRHILQAPGLDLGYAAEAFPGIQQALDDDDLKLAQEQLSVATERILSAARFLELN